MKDKKISNKNYSCFYNLKKKKNLLVFFNGLGGVKNFYYNFPKYCRKYGYLLVDFPGFGDSFYIKRPKSIIDDHIKILKKILKLHKIKKISLVIFSLSTSYLKILNQDNLLMKNIDKIFLLDPSLEKNDLNWSLNLYKKNKIQYKNYISIYKKELKYIFPMSLKKKIKNKKIIEQLLKFNSKVLYQLNKESVKIILKNNVLNFIKNKSAIFIYPKKKKFDYLDDSKIFFHVKDSNHYLFLDNPRETYNIIKNNV